MVDGGKIVIRYNHRESEHVESKTHLFCTIISDTLNGRPPEGVLSGIRRKWANNIIHQSAFEGQILEFYFLTFRKLLTLRKVLNRVG
jgi:hypothetical protein